MPQDKLNGVQQLVADNLDENILLVASAGTGKTNTLAIRIANILSKHRCAPEEILCLTFTNKACKEMRDRVATRIPGVLPPSNNQSKQLTSPEIAALQMVIIYTNALKV